MPDEPKTTLIRTRFAPSPTGALHLGNVRTALFNYLLARSQDGVFVLRSEDTDQERSSEASLASICEDLGWLDLYWDEGPDNDGDKGPAAPYRQSRRGDIYGELFEKLVAADRAYPCFCSQETLKAARRAQIRANKPPRYPGTCAGLSRDESGARLEAGEAATLRYRVPDEGSVTFDDLAKGEQTFALADIGDFVIRRANGTPSFFFSNAVDDALMDVSHVLRGEDHLANTPRQMLLLHELNLPVPKYGHIPLVVGEKGAPLSKRAGSVGLADLRNAGYLSVAIANYLARLGTVIASNALLPLAELAKAFDVDRLGKSPAHFDPIQLDHWQKEAMHGAAPDAMRAWMNGIDEVSALVPADEMDAFTDAVRDNVVLYADAIEWAHRIYDDRPAVADDGCEILSAAGDGFFSAALDTLATEPDYAGFIAGLKSGANVSGKSLFRPLRVAMTGTDQGPELEKLYTLLGTDRLRHRFEQARK